MNDVQNKLQQLAFDRIKTRLKHLRGKHDQLDHAWNRGMGRGGGGAALAPNQMGPLPTTDFYRQRRIELMDQQRQGQITNAEMRRQMRDLRGITVDAISNNTIEASTTPNLETEVSQIRAEIFAINREFDNNELKINQLITKQNNYRRMHERTTDNNTWIQLINAIGVDYLNTLESELSSFTNSTINNDQVKEKIRSLQSRIQNILNASEDEKEAFIDEFNEVASLFHDYVPPIFDSKEQKKLIAFSKTYASIFASVNTRIDPARSRVYGQRIGNRIAEAIRQLSQYSNPVIDTSNLQQIQDEYFNAYRSPTFPNQTEMDRLLLLRREIVEKRSKKEQELKDAKDKLRKTKKLITDKMYAEDPKTAPYYAPDVIPPETMELIEVHTPLSNALKAYGQEAEEAIRAIGLDIDNPEHIQMLGDLLGAFSDETSNSNFNVEISSYTNSFGEVIFDFRLKTTVRDGAKFIDVDREMHISPAGIDIKNSYFQQKNARGLGHAALTRQVPAAIKLSEMLGLPVRIEATALSREPDYVGYHVWPKMSFNFDVNDTVYEMFHALGFSPDELQDTFSLMASPTEAEMTRSMIDFAKMHNIPLSKIKALIGKNAVNIWGEIVELAMEIDGSIQETGRGYIDATDPDSPPDIEGIMIEFYNDYKRQQMRKASKSIKDKKYLPYLESQGFSMEDMEAFEYGWAMARKRGVIK